MEAYPFSLSKVTIPDNSASQPQLRPGSVLHATVEEVKPDGRYILNAGGLRISAESSLPLNRGARLDLLVTTNPAGKLALQVLPQGLGALTPDTLQIGVISREATLQVKRDDLSRSRRGDNLDTTEGTTEDITESGSGDDESKAGGSGGGRSVNADVIVKPNSASVYNPGAGALAAGSGGTELFPVDGQSDPAVDSVRSVNSSVYSETQQAAVSGGIAPGQTYALGLDAQNNPALLLPDGRSLPLTAAEFAEIAGRAGVRELLEIIASQTQGVAGADFTARFRLAEIALPLRIELPASTNADAVKVYVDALLRLSAPGGAALLSTDGALRLYLSVDPNNPQGFTATLGAGQGAYPLSVSGALTQDLFGQLVSLQGVDAMPGDALLLRGMLTHARANETLTMHNTHGIAAEQNHTTAAGQLQTLLRNAGLTPSPATTAAAEALLGQKLPVSRENVQTLLALAAGTTGDERGAILRAGARLLALDIPVARPLAAGMAQLMSPELNLSGRIGALAGGLRTAGELLPPELQSLAQGSARMAENLAVIVGGADSPQALSGFISGMGRELLAQVQQNIEGMATGLLETSPTLRILSAALEPVLLKLANLPLPPQTPAGAQGQGATGAQAAPAPALPQPGADGAAQTGAQAAAQAATPTTPAADIAAQIAGAAGNAASPAAGSGQLSPNLPGLLAPSASPASNTTPAPNISGSLPGALPPAAGTNPPVSELPAASAEAAQSAQPAGRLARLLESIGRGAAAASIRAGHPGAEGMADYLKSVPDHLRQPGRADLQAVDRLLGELARAQSPQEAAQITRSALGGMDSATLRELATLLQQAEREELRSLPALEQLKAASDEVRQLGRAFMAQKAENLATLRHDPAVYSAQIPLKFGDTSGDGQLQMFYRRKTGGKERDWTQRVVLDLRMSALGGVVGDLRFHAGQLNVSLLSEDPQTLAMLQEDADELATGLAEAGFDCTPGFRLLKKPEKASRKNEDTPQPAPPGRLDIRA